MYCYDKWTQDMLGQVTQKLCNKFSDREMYKYQIFTIKFQSYRTFETAWIKWYGRVGGNNVGSELGPGRAPGYFLGHFI